MPSFDLSLYLVTDQDLLAGRDLIEVVQQAIAGGVTLVQLREKKLDTKAFVAVARRLLQICRAANVPLLINDRLDVALAVEADGIHIGQGDMPLSIARRILGPGKIIGATVETPQQALIAVSEGADYIGTAAIFPTNTKKHPTGFAPLGFEGVKEILRTVRPFHIPVCTIGGINKGNVEEILKSTVVPADDKGPQTTLQGVAVVSAIISQTDPKGAAAELAAKVRSAISASTTLSVGTSLIRDPAATSLVDDVISAFRLIKSNKPLIHNITNYVVMNDTANTILQLGGLPVMAHATNEVADITAVSQALVINIGTLSPQWIEAMHIAGSKANELNVPVILDPVGAGATPFRKQTCLDLIEKVKMTVVKGNAGEIGAIAGLEGIEMRGVESVGFVSEPEKLVSQLASRLQGTCVAMSGPVDNISDGTKVVKVFNGNEWLGTLTGTGCSTSTLVACFAGVKATPLVSAVGGLVCMGLAAQNAVKSGKVDGPGSFKVSLHDALSKLDEDAIRAGALVQVL
ncbi:Hydroxyethylthiazole kinase family-domain-containing protein [Fimicolochytrium jonesii]|uniref:Hydroxyethylthiazole kinase family-domain-containing protein n=1 Tax=Fimicolochytrium jonesii TaxID=1396493 RepID=UPI0022FDD9A0|nr:Hydroxyethylthiazole kinase family-domain-containing protein [Fimicolochytrium jonesii]KAI8823468.1 Hydroxyethylthiazole kinase family-domain-containing protein [Fimicolochytrium jonesii]